MTTIQLRKVTDADFPTLFEHQLDPIAASMAEFPSRDWDAFQEHWQTILYDETVAAYAIMQGNKLVGNILSWKPADKRLIGYWIGREFWGKGIATAAITAYLKIITERPLYAHVAKSNVASIRVLEKCEFAIYKKLEEKSNDTVSVYFIS